MSQEYRSTGDFTRQAQLDPILGAERNDAFLRSKIQPADSSASLDEESRYSTERRFAAQGDVRSLFEKDRDKIASSAYFNRLQHITQVENPRAASPERVYSIQHYHSRLTHTLEVSRLALRIGRNVLERQEDLCLYYSGLNLDVLDAACLAHDLGHPPFGHVSEFLLGEYMLPYGGFEGNAQTIRILASLESRSNTGFLNLTRRTWASCMKYPWTFTEGSSIKATGRKFCVYDTPIYDSSEGATGYITDNNVFNWIFRRATTDLREDRLRTPEAEVMDYADDVAYATSDFCEAITANNCLGKLLEWNGFAQFCLDNTEELVASFRKEWGGDAEAAIGRVQVQTTDGERTPAQKAYKNGRHYPIATSEDATAQTGPLEDSLHR